MPKKPQQEQIPERRNPRQARALFKVELMLEAAMRIIDRSDIDSLTTNAVAAEAGVSIGTLYQYFKDKQAILQALVQRELGDMADKTLKSLTGPAPANTGDRIRAIVRAVLATYGGRQGVHRKLMQHALTRGTGQLRGLYAGIADMLTGEGVPAAGQPHRGRPASRPLSGADAFVLTHSVAGVVRALAASDDPSLSKEEVEEALVRLACGFLGVSPSEPVPALRPRR